MKNCNKTPHNGSREKIGNIPQLISSRIMFFRLYSSIFLFEPVSFRVSKGVNVYTFARLVNLETVGDKKKLHVNIKCMFSSIAAGRIVNPLICLVYMSCNILCVREERVSCSTKVCRYRANYCVHAVGLLL